MRDTVRWLESRDPYVNVTDAGLKRDDRSYRHGLVEVVERWYLVEQGSDRKNCDGFGRVGRGMGLGKAEAGD